MREVIARIFKIGLREIEIFSHRPMYLFVILIAPLLCLIYFTQIMRSGTPDKMPCGVVDEDNTSTTRSIVRILGAMQNTDIKAHYANFSEARKAMQRGEIYAFFYIPRNTTDKALSSRRPQISFYTADTWYAAGSLLMKDLQMTSELAGLAVTRASLSAKGVPPSLMMGILQPISIEAHPIANPGLNYSVYLNNIVVPGLFFLIIMLFTAYTIGYEWKMGTQKQLFEMAGESSTIAIAGKLWPQTLLYCLLMVLIDVYFYKFQGFPLKVSLIRIICAGWLCVFASQALAVFFFGIFLTLRMGMSACSLFGVLQISVCGFTFPLTAMKPVFQYLAWVSPLRHYYMLYVNQALNGFKLVYAWPSIVALLLICLLPLTMLSRIAHAFKYIDYKP